MLRRLTRSSAASASQSSSRSSPSAQTMKSNRHLPCGVSSPVQTGKLPGDVAGDQSLQESAHVLAGHADDRAIGQGGSGHALQLGSRAVTMQSLTIRRPDDWHVHLRDGEMLRFVAPYTARQFARAIVMPNLVPPVTTIDAARGYRERIREAAGPGFEPLMTCYLTDQADAAEIGRGYEQGVWTACKLYPANATTNSAHGVTDIRNIYPALERMQEIGMVFCVHGEVTDPDVDVFDREAVFIERVLTGVVRDFPALKIVLEHITTAEAARVRARCWAERRCYHHAAASCTSTAMRSSPAACGRTPTACRS